MLLPREEEPQIKVPMIDVLVSMPGFSAKEVEERATRPMEKLLWEIPNVEYIYSTSREGESLAIVRFKVGEDIERSLVLLNQKLQANFDRIPQGVSFPLIKPKSIDDVPILALTFHGAGQDHYTLRRIVAEVDDAVKQVPLVAETTLIGGERRQLRVLLDPAKLASRQLSAADIVPRLQSANRQLIAGPLADQQPRGPAADRQLPHQRQGCGQRRRRRARRKARLPARRGDDCGRAGGAEPICVLWGGRGAFSDGRRAARRHLKHRQAAGRKRHLGCSPGPEEGRDAQGPGHPQWRARCPSPATTARRRRRSPTSCCSTWASR